MKYEEYRVYSVTGQAVKYHKDLSLKKLQQLNLNQG